MKTFVRLACPAAVMLLAAQFGVLAGGSIQGQVNYKTPRWVRDTVVYLEEVPGDWKPEPARMDQKGSTFVPKFLPVIQGATVTFLNSDPTDHNVYTPDHEGYDLGTKGKGEMLEHTFDSLGVYTQLCKLHPTMIGYVLVLQNPFYAVSDKEGNFRIEGIPAGKYRLTTWHERYKADPIEVEVPDGGVAEVTVELHR